MPTLWTKIGLGAAGVFATGMLGITVFRQAAAATEHAVAHAVTSAVRQVAAKAQEGRSFRLNGEDVGALHAFSIRRAVRGDLPDIGLEVRLHHLAALKELAKCDITPEAGADAGNFEVDRGFRCATPAERPLVGVGTVRFVPGDIVRPILVSRRFEAELRGGDPFEVAGTVDGNIEVSARDGDGAMVRVRADSAGAAIGVNDELGRSLVRLFADSAGAALRIRGKDGREVVRLDASEGGFSLVVDTSAAN